MEIILKDDVKGLGYKNDIVKVKPGYGRNYLIPQGFAILATPSAKKVLAENIKQAQHKAERIKNDALALATSLSTLYLEIPAKAGESGKIFGAVTSIQVADVLKEKGFDIDRKKIYFKEDIKMLGEYEAHIDLHKEVKASVKINIVSAD